ncbi:MAG: hypothetical protein O7G85_05370, partial [Planctomycetota bacterium]|nr:hypothetical protein [Planctomycetota bacterium]
MRFAIISVMTLILTVSSASVYALDDELSLDEISSLEEFVEWAEEYSSRTEYIQDAIKPSLKTEEATSLLKRLESGHPLRMRIILAVRRNACPKDLFDRHDPHVHHSFPHGQLTLSWRILLDLELLHDGMTLELAAV